MKRDVFLFAVIVFAVFSAFIFYLDYSSGCASVICVASYISTGDASSYNYQEGDSVLSKIIYPFINPSNDRILLQPSSGEPGEPTVTPVITELQPSIIQNNIPNDIIVSGSNFVPEFAIGLRIEGSVDWDTICTSESGCVFTNSNLVAFQVPSGYVPGNYEVRYFDIVNSLESNYASLVIQSIPSSVVISPSGLTATALSSNSIRLNWADNSNDEDGFNLEYKISSDSNWASVPGAQNLPSNSVSFTHNGLIENTDYDYRVFAYNELGNSGYSNIASGRTSSSTLVISSIVPNLVLNDVPNTVDINGVNFDSNSIVMANGVNLPASFFTYVSPNLIRLNLPQGVVAGNFLVSVVNGNGDVSNSVEFVINYPFDFAMTLNPSSSSISQGYSFNVGVNIESLAQMTQEEVSVSFEANPEISLSFESSDRCVPDISAGANPSCTVIINVNVGSVTGTNYVIPITATSSDTGVVHLADLNLQVAVGTLSECSNGVQDSHESCIDGGGSICSPQGLLCDIGESCLSANDCAVSGSEILCLNNVCSISICGDSYCSLSESCSICASDCGACASSGGSSGGGGGGGGGGGSSGGSSGGIVRSQCSDGIDNDGDGLIDYPNDDGCSFSGDNVELQTDPLIGQTQETENSGETTLPTEEVFEIRTVFWIVLVILVAGIGIVFALILKQWLHHNKFKSITASNPDLNNSP